jgi:hypothetical protein
VGSNPTPSAKLPIKKQRNQIVLHITPRLFLRRYRLRSLGESRSFDRSMRSACASAHFDHRSTASAISKSRWSRRWFSQPRHRRECRRHGAKTLPHRAAGRPWTVLVVAGALVLRAPPAIDNQRLLCATRMHDPALAKFSFHPFGDEWLNSRSSQGSTPTDVASALVQRAKWRSNADRGVLENA